MFEVREVETAVAGLIAGSTAREDAATADWVELVGACQRLINQLSAVQTTALARLAAIEEVEHEDGTVTEEDLGLGHQRIDAPALVSDLLGLTDAGAGSRVEHAVRTVAMVPELVEAMSAGVLDTYRAGVVSQELADAPAETCAAVMAVVAPHLGSEPAGPLRRRVRRVLGRVAPDLVRVKAERARGDRALRRWTHQAGVDEWSGTFPVEQARPAWAVIDKLAKQLVRDGQSANLDQARADALMQLIHGQSSGTYVVQVAVSADDVARHSRPADEADELVDVTGLGIPGVTTVSRAWLDSIPGSPTARHSTRPMEEAEHPVRVATEVAVCETSTGGVVGRIDRTGTGPPRARGGGVVQPSYVPPAWMVSLVKARDGGCRFPGCTVAARFCDLDHVVPWPAGPTALPNLACLCRRHHRIKQRRGWRARLDGDGTMTWTDPTGRTRTTHPQDLLAGRTAASTSAGRGERATSPDEVPLDHALAFGIEGSWSSLEEELELFLMTAEREAVRALDHGPPDPAATRPSLPGPDVPPPF
jgi:hypothetical protein